MRILICYATAGAGHRRAAEALAEAARTQWPHAQVECVDILDYTPRWFQLGYAWSYLFLVQRASWVWRLSYTLLDREAIFRCVQPWRRVWNGLITRRFVRWLKTQPPDVVVAAHFLPAEVCSAGKRAGRLHARLVVAVTDWHPHWFWIASEADAVVVATAEGASLCRRRGIPADRVQAIGIPIAPAATQDRDGLKERLHLVPQRRTILITSGGTTVGPFERVVRALVDLEDVMPGRLQLLVVCGENHAAARRLNKLAGQAAMPVTVMGFIDHMRELMAVSDLIVAKAGGMTLAEALGQGVPLVLYHAIPGQERFNARHVSRAGAAVVARSPSDVAQIVRRCWEDPAYLAAMRKSAQALGRPDAAQAIVTHVIQPLLLDANP